MADEPVSQILPVASAQTAVLNAQTAKLAADKAVVEYQHYMHGGGRKPNVLDEGSQDKP